MAEKLNTSASYSKQIHLATFRQNSRELLTQSEAHNDDGEFALKQLRPGKQLLLMTDARIRIASYALISRENRMHKIPTQEKKCACGFE